MSGTSTSSRWLAIGAVLGALGAALSLLEGGLFGERTSLSDDVVAVVNDVEILEGDYETAQRLLLMDKRNELTDEDRARVLDKLIEEELLIQRGIEIGLAASDPNVRKQIARAMIDSIITDSSTRPLTSREIETFYRDHHERFVTPARLSVELHEVASDERGNASERASEAYELLMAGAAVSDVAHLLDPPAVPLPRSLLPPAKLREYIGPTLVAVAQRLAVGELARPQRTTRGWAIVRLLERSEVVTPPLEQIRDLVEIEARRQRSEDELGRYLERLKRGATIAVRPDAAVTSDDAD